MSLQTPSRWADLSSTEVASSCAEGTLIHEGPLNLGFRAHLRGEVVFVRQRLIDDPEYGQLFGAEELVYPLLPDRVPVPRMYARTPPDGGVGPYAVFEYLDRGGADSLAVPSLEDLAARLAAVHSVTGDRVGGIDIRGPHRRVSDFYCDAVGQEVAQLGLPASALTARTGSERWRSHVMDAYSTEPIVLCHGDVHAGNWLPDSAGRWWLIDWEASRYRSAAADFNQLHWRWMREDQEAVVIRHYAEITRRDECELRAQILIARVLWHLRTFNFYTFVKREAPSRHEEHLVAAADLVRSALNH